MKQVDHKQSTISKAEARGRLFEILSQHIGIERAIGMGELYEFVYGRPWLHRINDTRDLRKLITELRHEGKLIASTPKMAGGGYYLARSVHEMAMFFDRAVHRHLKGLAMIARMKKIGLPEFLGQMQLNLERTGEAETGETGERDRAQGR